MSSSDRPIHVVSLCGTGNCPTIYLSGSEREFIIRGRRLSAEERSKAGLENVPADEELIEIPAALIDELIRHWRER